MRDEKELLSLKRKQHFWSSGAPVNHSESFSAAHQNTERVQQHLTPSGAAGGVPSDQVSIHISTIFTEGLKYLRVTGINKQQQIRIVFDFKLELLYTDRLQALVGLQTS